MTFLPTVVRAEYRGDYRIHLAFNDGLENTLDFPQWRDGPIFEPLKDPVYFRRFFVGWPRLLVAYGPKSFKTRRPTR